MTKRATDIPEPNPSGLCFCGCGLKTPLAKQSNRQRGTVVGKLVCFVAGHQVRKMQQGNTTHALSHTPEWKAYWGARDRCTNPEHPQFSDYGGRGIQFLFSDFESF